MCTEILERCRIWGVNCTVRCPGGRPTIEDCQIDSPRAGGSYRIANDADREMRNLDGEERQRLRPLLTTWIVTQHISGNNSRENPPLITRDVFQEIRDNGGRLPCEERRNRFLRRFIHPVVSNIDTTWNNLATDGEALDFLLAFSESNDENELNALRRRMIDDGILTERDELTEDGFLHLQRLIAAPAETRRV